MREMNEVSEPVAVDHIDIGNMSIYSGSREAKERILAATDEEIASLDGDLRFIAEALRMRLG